MILDQEPRSPDDIRFQFEIIKELAASVREVTNHMRVLQEQTGEALIRLERIEAREHSEQIAELKGEMEVLKTDYYRRVGRDGFIATVFKSPFLAWIVVFAGIVYTAVKDQL